VEEAKRKLTGVERGGPPRFKFGRCGIWFIDPMEPPIPDR